MSSDAAHSRLRFRHGVAPPQRPTEQPTPEVLDDFPDVIPITSAELEVIETYLGGLVSQLLEVTEEPTATTKGEDL